MRLERQVDPASLNDLVVGDAVLAAFDIRHVKTEALLWAIFSVMPLTARTRRSRSTSPVASIVRVATSFFAACEC